jgi:UDP-N-acetylglucosamine--N-acetylmuramyl-(pentapeptide) pyrophosphoryl-undecaprenol N-acetylglucosamine transferase
VSYAIAAAGTGGHVFPGLSVGEALVRSGVDRSDILYLGGSRLESRVYPAAGFPFLEVELRGLRRSLSAANLGIPRVVMRAVSAMSAELTSRRARVVLGMGGYVTVPAAMAARRSACRLAVSEQNAEAGLANALVSRIADRSFGAFPVTARMPRAIWVGNPMRYALSTYDRSELRAAALERYRLDPDLPVVGVFGGSLGAGVINAAVSEMARGWMGPPCQILHLAGADHVDDLQARAVGSAIQWTIVGFEEAMEYFYAASDLVIARAGGAVAELAATATPSILVPGVFGSGHHQQANAAAFAGVGGAVVVEEAGLAGLGRLVAELLSDSDRRQAMAGALAALAKPDAADVIAAALEELHG